MRSHGRTHVDSLITLGLPSVKEDDDRLDPTGQWVASDVHMLSMTCEDWQNGAKDRIARLASVPPAVIADVAAKPNSSNEEVLSFFISDQELALPPPAELRSTGVVLRPFDVRSHSSRPTLRC